MDYQVHSIDWSDEKVKRFWDFYNNYEAFEQLWFSKNLGKGIIKFVGRHTNIEGNVLDYGTGKGHLSGFLMENDKVNLTACDFSDETIININSKFSSVANFKGCFLVKEFPSSFKENQFDIIFLVEAIEHLTDDYLLPTLSEIRRILKPGGSVIVTTPNEENLALQNVCCPECGCVFHRVQHVRSFNKESLRTIMSNHNFKAVFCNAIDFEDYGGKRKIKLAKNFIRPLLGLKKYTPHLVYIGKK